MDSFKIFLAKYVVFAVILIWIWVWLKTKRSFKAQLLMATICAGITALVISRIAGKLYYDPRPFVTSNVKPLISHSSDNGFPSDHVLLSATLSTVIYYYSKRWAIISAVLVVLVAIGRVLVHVHSPIDVIGACVIGVVSAAAGYLVAKKLKPAQQKSKPTAKASDQAS